LLLNKRREEEEKEKEGEEERENKERERGKRRYEQKMFNVVVTLVSPCIVLSFVYLQRRMDVHW